MNAPRSEGNSAYAEEARRSECTAKITRYREALESMPPSGGGGCHSALLGVANLGAIAELSAQQVFEDLRRAVHGGRHVPSSEIEAAVRKAFSDHSGKGCEVLRPVSGPPPTTIIDSAKLLAGLMEVGQQVTDAEKWIGDVSPKCINWEPEQDAQQTLQRLYEPDDRLFIGSRYNTGPEHVRSAAEWAAEFARGGAVPEHIVPNPLTGEAALKKDGGRSYRADACVAKFRFAVVEFDTTPAPLRTPAQQEAAAKILGRQYVPDELEGLQRKLVWPRCEQLRFWLGAVSYGWPIAALIDSGGKSVHGWLRVDAKDAADWDETVERGLFGMLKPLGVDASCKNECRLSRMPGHFRIEKGNWQRLLYLDPTKGGTSCR